MNTFPDTSSISIRPSDLRPYGSLTICKVAGQKPDLVLPAVAQAALHAATSRRRHASTSAMSVSSVTRVGTIDLIVLGWEEHSPSSGYTDGRLNRRHRYFVAASDGEFVLWSSDSEPVAKGVLRWARSPQQGFVAQIDGRTFRELAAGKVAVAAWLRNTSPGRHGQFTTLALGAPDVGAGTSTADFTAYLANTVRVSATAADGDELVTVSPDMAKLAFRRTDRIDTWVKLAELSLVWLRQAEATASGGCFLPGTADVLDSLDSVGEPYEVMLTVPPLQLSDDAEDIEDYEPSVPAVSFEVPPRQPADCFDCRAHVGPEYAGTFSFRLRPANGRWELDLSAELDVTEPTLARTVRQAVEEVGVEIHFVSQHLYSGGVIAFRPVEPLPFRGYTWSDFEDIDVTLEKPSNDPTTMRQLIGTDADASLFGWAVRERKKGWLVCDDGANETADFIHLTDDGIELIAIKAAEPAGRATSTGAIHLVQAQASKNLPFLHNLPLLHQTLARRASGLVVFKGGIRQDSPIDFLDALADVAAQPALIEPVAVVVQPQLNRVEVDKAHLQMGSGARSTTVLGMMRIDAMFRSLNARCAELGIKLEVVGRV